MKWMFISLGLMVALVIGYFAAVYEKAGNVISVGGSTSVQPFAEMLSEVFNERHPELHIEVQGGGSSAGLQGVKEDTFEVGMCSRGLKDHEEPLFTPIRIARDALAIVIHEDNPVKGLSREQIRDIFSGRLTNWQQVGGLDQPIHMITREEGSGTREAFQKMIMGDERISREAITQESNGTVKELVRQDLAGIGYMSLGLVNPPGATHAAIKAIRINGVEPTSENVINDSYPLVRPFLFVLGEGEQPGPGAQAFIDFVLSDEGQAMLEQEGLVRTGE
jgi:phosphate transport system substrate-binding protein